jgi:hypothetical protein
MGKTLDDLETVTKWAREDRRKREQLLGGRLSIAVELLSRVSEILADSHDWKDSALLGEINRFLAEVTGRARYTAAQKPVREPYPAGAKYGLARRANLRRR